MKTAVGQGKLKPHTARTLSFDMHISVQSCSHLLIHEIIHVRQDMQEFLILSMRLHGGVHGRGC